MAANDDRIVQLLTEIRNGQQEHLREYREVARRSLDAQQSSLDIQRGHVKFYRAVVIVFAVVIGALSWYLYTLSKN